MKLHREVIDPMRQERGSKKEDQQWREIGVGKLSTWSTRLPAAQAALDRARRQVILCSRRLEAAVRDQVRARQTFVAASECIQSDGVMQAITEFVGADYRPAVYANDNIATFGNEYRLSQRDLQEARAELTRATPLADARAAQSHCHVTCCWTDDADCASCWSAWPTPSVFFHRR